MRDILFKAKRMDNGEWVEGSFLNVSNKHFYIFTGKLDISNGYLDFEKYSVNPDTICQYTGLTDRTKNKAFENSIIKIISENVFGVVKFGEYKNPFDNEVTKHVGFYVDWENDDRCKFWRKDLGYWLNADAIICGNIFDNHELLENE